MKICVKCGLEKEESCFSKNRDSHDGLQRACKDCNRLYREQTRDARILYARTYYQDNKDLLSEQKKEYIARDPEKWTNYHASYYKENKTRIISVKTEYTRNRRNSDPDFLLKDRLRARFYAAIKKGYKAGSAVRDLGCSISELRAHLESKFSSGMTWDSYGKGPGYWNIDHIIPLAAFNLANRQHVVLACYYLNLQPLWFEENSSKGAKIDF